MKTQPRCDAKDAEGRRCPDSAGFRVADPERLQAWLLAPEGLLPLEPGAFCRTHAKGKPRVALEELRKRGLGEVLPA